MESRTTIAALAGRRLRQDEIRKSTHIARAVAGFFVLISVAAFVQTAGQTDTPGKLLLGTVVWINVAAVMITALTVFPSILADERDSGTLTLLKLASSGDGSVLAGLVVPRLMFAIALIAIQIPFSLLAVTLGGVTARQVLGCYGTLMLSVVLLCSLTTLFATLTRTAGAVIQVIVAYFFAAFVVAFGLSLVVGGPLSSETIAGVFAAFPAIEIAAWMESPGKSFFGPFFWSVVGQSAIASLLAWIVFPTSELEAGESGEAATTKFRQWVAKRRKFAPTDFKRGPHVWKDFHLVAGGHAGWAIRSAAYLVVPVTMATFQLLTDSSASRNAFNVSAVQAALGLFGSSLTMIVGYALPVECAWLAAKRIRLELDENTWELLELLPTSRQYVLSGKGAGAIRGLYPGILLSFVGLVAVGVSSGLASTATVVLVGGVFGGTMTCAILVCVWFLASHLALRMRTGPATGLTILGLVAVPVFMVIAMMMLGGLGILVAMIAIPLGLGLLVAAITSFSDRFYQRALQGSDES